MFCEVPPKRYPWANVLCSGGCSKCGSFFGPHFWAPWPIGLSGATNGGPTSGSVFGPTSGSFSVFFGDLFGIRVLPQTRVQNETVSGSHALRQGPPSASSWGSTCVKKCFRAGPCQSPCLVLQGHCLFHLGTPSSRGGFLMK